MERGYNCSHLSLFLDDAAAFPVELVRGGVALDTDVGHGLRTELDRAVEDPSPVVILAPCAARDQVDVARPALHGPDLFFGEDGGGRRNEQCDCSENPES